MKKCNKCGTTRQEKFASTQRYRCRKCTNDYSQANYRLNKSKIINQSLIRNKQRILKAKEFVFNYLRAHPCVDCAEVDLVVLEFDHCRGTKSHNISDLIRTGSAISTLSKEIAKCEVVCANCHRRRTAKRHGGWARSKLL